jgi:8-oxo-dGTP diphosphatase
MVFTMTDIPKTTVVVLVFIRQDGAILLVKQDYGRQYWSLPGGVMEAGESVDQTALREVREETGLEIQLGRLVGVYSKPEESAVALTFEAAVTGGERKASNEILETRYFYLYNLPENIREQLRERVADYQAGIERAVVRTQ